MLLGPEVKRLLLTLLIMSFQRNPSVRNTLEKYALGILFFYDFQQRREQDATCSTNFARSVGLAC